MATISEVRSARSLRTEVCARHLAHTEEDAREVTVGNRPGVLHRPDKNGGHGNFLTPSYRRICAHPAWKARLDKAYTSEARVPRRYDRRRGELECASSSDALLMNVFCYPGMMHRSALCGVLGVEAGCVPEFGVRVSLPMRRNEVDRTELDMRLGDVLAEAKLTEGGFGTATRERAGRYLGMEEMFALEELTSASGRIVGYQILRGMLSAAQGDGRYLVLLDARRADLAELCFRVARACRRSCDASRLRLLTWQHVASTTPPRVQRHLAERYGIEAASR